MIMKYSDIYKQILNNVLKDTQTQSNVPTNQGIYLGAVNFGGSPSANLSF